MSTTNNVREYELVYIIQPNLDEDDVVSLDERVAQSIQGQGGQISSTEKWGKRSLAYPIKNHFEGHYILHQVEMPPNGMDEVELTLRYSEDVIRYMAIRKDEQDQ